MSKSKSAKHISLVIPCYNIDQYIGDCLRSVMQQKDIEKCQVICINDGSSDGTGKILNRYSHKYPNIIQVIENKNNYGVSIARNIGLDMVRGTSVMFMDGDDLIGGRPDLLHRIDKYYLESFYDTLMSNDDCGMVVGNMVYADSKIKDIVNTKRTVQMTGLLAKGKVPHDKAIDFLDTRLSSCATLYRADLIQKHNIRFRPQMMYYEDADFVTRYAIHASQEYPHILVPTNRETYYLYRRRPNSAMLKLSRHSVKHIRRLERTKDRLIYYATLLDNCATTYGESSRIYNIAAHRYTASLKLMMSYATLSNSTEYSALSEYIPVHCMGCYSHDCSSCPNGYMLEYLYKRCLSDFTTKKR